nr:uncharacterized protein LOC117987496 [Maniola hyperantus]
MNWEPYLPVLMLLFGKNDAVRLHKLFQFLDGFKSEHDLQGFLHVGEDYAVFLRKPKSHDKLLTYELYEAKNAEETNNYRPRLLAISRVPVEYIKEQLKKYREELYSAKYVDNNIVPGTEVKTLREWQIDRAVDLQQGLIAEKPNILRTVVL